MELLVHHVIRDEPSRLLVLLLKYENVAELEYQQNFIYNGTGQERGRTSIMGRS